VHIDPNAEAFVIAIGGYTKLEPVGDKAIGAEVSRRAKDMKEHMLEKSKHPGGVHLRGIRTWLEEAICFFGRLEDTPADRQVLRKWLGAQMKAGDVRTKDAVDWIPMVVELYFLPTTGELRAQRIRDSVAYSTIQGAGRGGGRS
jgi:hypothetical protein